MIRETMSTVDAKHQASPLTSSWSSSPPPKSKPLDNEPEKSKHDVVVSSDVSDEGPRKPGGWNSMVYILGLWISITHCQPLAEPILGFWVWDTGHQEALLPKTADDKSNGWLAFFIALNFVSFCYGLVARTGWQKLWRCFVLCRERDIWEVSHVWIARQLHGILAQWVSLGPGVRHQRP